MLSGSRTTKAMMMPTTVLGAPMLATAISKVGDSALASSTTAPRQTNKSTALRLAIWLEGGGACTSSSASATTGRK